MSREVHVRFCESPGVRFPRATHLVVLARTAEAIAEAERRISIILARLKLAFNPDKTRKVLLTNGRESFEFLGCHLRKRVSGRLLERGICRYYLQRWPSERSMCRVRRRVHELTDRRRNGVKDVRVLIRDLNPVLQGWGNYFRTGNAGRKFLGLDRYVSDRLRRFLVKRAGRKLRPGRTAQWTQEWFWGQGLHRLGGTIRYPKSCVLDGKTIAKPDAGEPHVRFERGLVETGRLRAGPRH